MVDLCKIGRVIDANSPAELAAHMTEMLQNPERGHATDLHLLTERYGWDTVIALMLANMRL